MSGQTIHIDIPEHRFRIDPFDHIIVIQHDSLETFTGLAYADSVVIALTNFEFGFIGEVQSFEHTSVYTVNDGIDDYSLFFTQLPLIKIQSSAAIPNEPKVPAIFYYADDSQIVISYIGIELRGGASQGFAKKTYDMEFWEDAQGDNTRNVQFGNMRDDDDWILDGMYNEPLRLRSPFSAKLWLKMHQPYYANLEPEAKAGADVKYAELFLNGRYKGIYALSEQVDRKLLELEMYDGNIRGELYKGDSWGSAVTFQGTPGFDNNSRFWGGHEMKYPQEEIFTDWQYLHDFTDFVINSTDEAFEDIWTKFNYQNFIDYFIFLNLSRATDNTGKNIYIASYDIDHPYFYVPWDLDGTFGQVWNGSQGPATTGILTNGFYDRVLDSQGDDFLEDASARWAELRMGVLHLDSIDQAIHDAYNLLIENNIYARESLVFPNYAFDQASFDYFLNWTDDRIAYLDGYFDYVVGTSDQLVKSDWRAYPNPARTDIYITKLAREDNVPFRIFDISGRSLITGILISNRIDVSMLTPGVYILSIGTSTQKIIIQ